MAVVVHRDTERQRETDRERQRDTQRQTETDTERERESKILRKGFHRVPTLPEQPSRSTTETKPVERLPLPSSTARATC